ncbi:MAG: ABC transporter permease [Candidatus Saccharibacteria bacterium]|nr:ABC transporter permease [Candidatus Saccharibacteria bacterium]
MTTYRAFLKVLRKNVWVIVIYTVILLLCVFGNTQSGQGMTNFTASKPDVTIYDSDKSLLSRRLEKYFSAQATIVELNTEEKLDDALYFNGTDYVIYVEKGFGEQIARGEKPEMVVKSVGNYDSYLAETMLSRFLKLVEVYAPASQEELVKNLDKLLEHETKVEMTSKLDTVALTNAKNYYNFMNYAILAGLVFAVAYSTASFKREMTRKRIAVSATNYRKINRQLLICNLALAMVLLLFYVILSLIIIGDIILTMNGALFIANAAILSVFGVSLAFFLVNLLKNNNAILALINVISIGSCFLSGVFVPAEWMPVFVQNIGRALPSFYYVENNRLISELEKFDFESLKPILINALVIIGASIIVVILNNIITRRKQKD